MLKADEWWCSLHVTEKERIGTKIKGAETLYPECTVVWLTLDEKQRTWIKEHCTKANEVVIPNWQDGQLFTE